MSNPKHKGPHCDGYCEGAAYTLNRQLFANGKDGVMKVDISEMKDRWAARDQFWIRASYTDIDGRESIDLPCGANRTTARSKAVKALQKMIKQIEGM